MVENEFIEAEATRLHEISSCYHLSHAVTGCEKMLEAIMEKAGSIEVDRLTKELLGTDDDDEIERIIKEIDYISKNRSHIFVDYVDFAPDCARALMINNNISISLPHCLQNDKSTNNSQLLRKLIAHEIGHIVLHTDKILGNESPRGTLSLEDDVLEKEADIFAQKILALRREHYQNALESREFERY